MKSLDEIIQQKIKEAQKPLVDRINDLEKQVGSFQKEQPCMIEDHQGNKRSAVRLIVAAKRMQVHPSTICRMWQDPMNPLEGVRIGRMVYLFEDTLIFNQSTKQL